MSDADTELGTPWARRRWAAVDHMTVRGSSRRSSGTARSRPVAGRPRGRADGDLATQALARVASAGSRPGGLSSAYPLFATRVAGHEPEPTGLLPARGTAGIAAAWPMPSAIRAAPVPARTAVAPHLVPSALRHVPAESATESATANVLRPLRRLPASLARAVAASVPNAFQPGSHERLLARVLGWARFATRNRRPRERNWPGWRERVEPTVFASFALIASAAAVIGLYSFSNSGMYNPVTAFPSQTNGAPPNTPAIVAPGVRAIHQAPGTRRAPGSSGSSAPQAYASWPAPGDPVNGSTSGAGATHAVAGAPPTVVRSHTPAGGPPGPTPTPSATPTDTPTPTDTATASPTDSATASPTDSATATGAPAGGILLGLAGILLWG